MDEDQMLEELARLARQRKAGEAARGPDPWRELASGTLSEAEVDRLREQAARSEEARLAFEVFRPLGAGFHARVVEGFQGGLPESEAASAPERDSRSTVPAARWRRWWPRLAAAAAILVLVTIGWPRGSAPLPRFEVEVDGVALERSAVGLETERPPVLVPGSTFRVIVRPVEEVSGSVEAVFFVELNGEWRSWPVETRRASSGALEVEQPFEGEVTLGAGVWQLAVAVGRDLPPSATIVDVLTSGGDRGERGWQLLVTSFEVRPEGHD